MNKSGLFFYNIFFKSVLALILLVVTIWLSFKTYPINEIKIVLPYLITSVLFLIGFIFILVFREISTSFRKKSYSLFLQQVFLIGEIITCLLAYRFIMKK
jgi:hypothetical protein